MHHQPSSHEALGVGTPDSLDYQAQRLVLYELIVDPPAAGDEIAALPACLELPAEDVERALAMLIAAGLAERTARHAFATRAARTFEALLSVRL
jgi:hypothetical protein